MDSDRTHDLLDSPDTPRFVSLNRIGALPANETMVRVFGVVTALRKFSRIRFFVLHYSMGSIQLAAERGAFTDKDWTAVKGVKKGHRIQATGRFGRSASGESTVFLTSPPTAEGVLLAGTLAETTKSLENPTAVGASILTAALRRAGEDFLEAHDYLRINPRHLSASWGTQRGLEPLRVLYPGFGIPVYLAPSPSPQLIDAITATGENRVFASGTSFSTSYRGSTDGVETALIMTRSIDITLPALKAQARALLTTALDRLDPQARRGRNWIEREEPVATIGERASDPTNFQVWTHSTIDVGLAAFRILLPGGFVAIEGAVEQRGHGLPLGSLAFHPERMLPILQQTPLRRLTDLG